MFRGDGGGYLIIAGPHGEGGPSRLFRWSGDPDTAPRAVGHVDFPGLNPEAHFFSGERIMVLGDDGTRGEPGHDEGCKDLAPMQQKSRGVQFHP